MADTPSKGHDGRGVAAGAGSSGSCVGELGAPGGIGRDLHVWGQLALLVCVGRRLEGLPVAVHSMLQQRRMERGGGTEVRDV